MWDVKTFYRTPNDGWCGTWVKYENVFKLLASNCTYNIKLCWFDKWTKPSAGGAPWGQLEADERLSLNTFKRKLKEQIIASYLFFKKVQEIDDFWLFSFFLSISYCILFLLAYVPCLFWIFFFSCFKKRHNLNQTHYLFDIFHIKRSPDSSSPDGYFRWPVLFNCD